MSFNNLFIVAEIATSHGGSFDKAIELINAAKEAGADAVKFQTYTPEEIAVHAPIVGGPWHGKTYYELYREGMTPWEWHGSLFAHARNVGLIPFSSPFSEAAVDRLESIDCPIYKIASPEIIHYSLIAAAARTGKPLIISTGMASYLEIMRAKHIAEAHGATDITLLHCVSSYPAKPHEFNLRTLIWMKQEGLNVGLSDHSLGHIVAVAAVGMGATVIEKHLKLEGDTGLDADHSLTPHEFDDFVWACRTAHEAIGDAPFSKDWRKHSSYKYRRSIWVVKDIKVGEKLTPKNVAILRPNDGLSPSYWDAIIGKETGKNLPAGTPLSLKYLK